MLVQQCSRLVDIGDLPITPIANADDECSCDQYAQCHIRLCDYSRYGRDDYQYATRQHDGIAVLDSIIPPEVLVCYESAE